MKKIEKIRIFFLAVSLLYIWRTNRQLTDNGKPVAKQGRKTRGLSKIAQSPKEYTMTKKHLSTGLISILAIGCEPISIELSLKHETKDNVSEMHLLLKKIAKNKILSPSS